MSDMFRTVLVAVLLVISGISKAQPNVHGQSSQYHEWPSDPQVRAKLDEWQDKKFGMIIHWGLYAVPGIIESWNLCSEDWINRDSTIAYPEYKKWYWGLAEKFNPVNFDPDSWADAADKAGMKYLVFTTKHHDGFNMFDTKQTSFKISAGPFRSHPRADVAKYVFESFRKKNFMIGAYFSKPDWHSENYWWPRYATADRNNNYDIRKFPWRWNSFKQFTFNQINELMSGYGSIDILWLDGGWVRPRETVNDEVRSWGARIPEWSQDIDMPNIAAMARKHQPGILIVDRTVHGPYENYQTPEQRVPEKQLAYPWESCMTLANNWGHVPGDVYKPASRIIHTLTEVVAKGGSLLLGIGPKADGTLPAEAVERMQEIGKWMRQNGEAIYNTRTVPFYQDNNVWFTRSKQSSARYAVTCFKDDENVPATIRWKHHIPRSGTRIRLLQTGENVKWKLSGDVVEVAVPRKLAGTKAPALAFSFEAGE